MRSPGPGRQGTGKKLLAMGKHRYQQGLSPFACKYLLTGADTADANPTFRLTHSHTRPGSSTARVVVEGGVVCFGLSHPGSAPPNGALHSQTGLRCAPTPCPGRTSPLPTREMGTRHSGGGGRL